MAQPALNPRESGQFISDNARHISIESSGVSKCARFLLDRMDKGTVSLEDLFAKTDVHPKKADVDGINWIFLADTLNFSFWSQKGQPQYKITYKGTTYSGYLSLCAAINRTLDEGVALTDPNIWGKITVEQLDKYLMADNGVHCPMIEKRIECLHEVADVLQSKYSGSVVQLIESADKSAEKLLHLITTDFPCFQDGATFPSKDGSSSRRVSLFKRAQILISDLWSLFRGKGYGEFKDIEYLTMFADYRVPQSLQYFGVFKYSEELLAKLRSNELLPSGSEMEVEIRGCSIKAVDLILHELKVSLDCKHTVNGLLLDYFLWSFRREKAKEMEQFPFHKTRSVYY